MSTDAELRELLPDAVGLFRTVERLVAPSCPECNKADVGHHNELGLFLQCVHNDYSTLRRLEGRLERMFYIPGIEPPALPARVSRTLKDLLAVIRDPLAAARLREIYDGTLSPKPAAESKLIRRKDVAAALGMTVEAFRKHLRRKGSRIGELLRPYQVRGPNNTACFLDDPRFRRALDEAMHLSAKCGREVNPRALIA